MSTNDSRPRAWGLALLLLAATLLTGCSNGMQDRSVELSGKQMHELRDRALYQTDR